MSALGAMRVSNEVSICMDVPGLNQQPPSNTQECCICIDAEFEVRKTFFSWKVLGNDGVVGTCGHAICKKHFVDNPDLANLCPLCRKANWIQTPVALWGKRIVFLYLGLVLFVTVVVLATKSI